MEWASDLGVPVTRENLDTDMHTGRMPCEPEDTVQVTPLQVKESQRLQHTQISLAALSGSRKPDNLAMLNTDLCHLPSSFSTSTLSPSLTCTSPYWARESRTLPICQTHADITN